MGTIDAKEETIPLERTLVEELLTESTGGRHTSPGFKEVGMIREPRIQVEKKESISFSGGKEKMGRSGGEMS